jgi:nitroreductase
MALFTAIGTAVGATILGSATLAGAAIVGGTAAIGYSINRSDKAASAQRAAASTQQRMQQQQATRQRRSAIRSSLIRRQQMLTQARALGVSGGSAVGGGLSSLSSQLGANLGFSSMMSGLGQQYSAFTQQAADFTGQSQLFGQIGQILLGAPTFGATAAPTPQGTPSRRLDTKGQIF